MIKLITYTFTLVLALLSNQTSVAGTFTTSTISTENRSPIIQLFSLARGDYQPNRGIGDFTWQPLVEVSNYISSTRKSGDFILLDGETSFFINTFRYQYTPETTIQTSLPLLSHNKGFLDQFIYHFHDALQLPQNGRTSNNHDRMKWVLQSNSEEVLRFEEPQGSIGDISFKIGWKPKAHSDIQLNYLVKIPTGSFKKQTGSENVDIGVSASQMNPEWFKQRNFLSDSTLAFWFGGGLSYLGKTDELSKFKRYPFSFTLRTGIAWSLYASWQLKFQMDTNSPLFKTEIRELGWFPVQFSIASTYNIKRNIQADFLIIEDLRPRATPDVTFSTGLSYTF